jgi:predicted transcriptional regulator
MAQNSPVGALLSIKPIYANAILEGRTKVEFRKRPFKRAVTHVIIYATAPMQRVIGWFRTKRSEQMSPAALWKRFAAVGGISHDDFEAYYGSSESGVAIHVEKPRRFKTPLPLSKVCSTTPPQSYAYLGSATIKRLTTSTTPLPQKRSVIGWPNAASPKAKTKSQVKRPTKKNSASRSN